MPAQIFVRISGKTHAFEIDLDHDTPNTLLNIISQRLRIPNEVLFLSYQGKPLSDSIKLSKYGMRAYSTCEGSIRAFSTYAAASCVSHELFPNMTYTTRSILGIFKEAIQSHHISCVIKLLDKLQELKKIQDVILCAVEGEELLCVEMLVLGKLYLEGLQNKIPARLPKETPCNIELSQQSFDIDTHTSEEQPASSSIVCIANKRLAVALGLACQRDKVKVIQHLFNLHGSSEIIDQFLTPRGNTMLHISAMHNSFHVMHLLLSQHAKPDVWNLEGLTPFQLAYKRGHILCTYQLILFGAKVETQGVEAVTREEQWLQFVPSLRTDMKSLLINASFSDITFIVENKQVNCHKCILSARSEYFRLLFSNNMKECTQSTIQLSNIDYDTFWAVLHFLYSEQLPSSLDSNQTLQVLFASDMYLLDQLKNFCVLYLCHTLLKSPSELISFSQELLQSANKHFLTERFPQLLENLKKVVTKLWPCMLGDNQKLQNLHPDFIPLLFGGCEFAESVKHVIDPMLTQ